MSGISEMSPNLGKLNGRDLCYHSTFIPNIKMCVCKRGFSVLEKAQLLVSQRFTFEFQYHPK